MANFLRSVVCQPECCHRANCAGFCEHAEPVHYLRAFGSEPIFQIVIALRCKMDVRASRTPGFGPALLHLKLGKEKAYSTVFGIIEISVCLDPADEPLKRLRQHHARA